MILKSKFWRRKKLANFTLANESYKNDKGEKVEETQSVESFNIEKNAEIKEKFDR
jgi:single-strand DNA-binding protein